MPLTRGRPKRSASFHDRPPLMVSTTSPPPPSAAITPAGSKRLRTSRAAVAFSVPFPVVRIDMSGSMTAVGKVLASSDRA
jgi:hypothetical protein